MNSGLLTSNHKIFVRLIISISVIVPIVVAALMYMPRESGNSLLSSYRHLPLFHAVLNGLTAITLIIGFYFIRQKKILKHRICMIIALCLSTIFLISYLVYHYKVPSASYGGQGAIRYVYFFILISHIILAAGIVPLALFTSYHAFVGQFNKHKPIAKWTLPIWLYVALTGVIVYIMMYPYYPYQ